MDALAEGLWGLADHQEQKGEFAKAIKCLEAICQSPVSFLPIIEVKTRLRIATLLLHHFHNVNHAKSHLERSQLLLKSIPSCFELKCRAYSLLSQCYHLVGAIPNQKQILNKGLELTQSLADRFVANLWYCNFSSQLSNALIIEGDYQNSLNVLDRGYNASTEIGYPELQDIIGTVLDGQGGGSTDGKALAAHFPIPHTTWDPGSCLLYCGFVANLWYCNFSSQLSNALIIEGDYQNSLNVLDRGYNASTEIGYPELQMFFATSILHVHLMQWDDVNLVERALAKCDEVWESFDLNKLRICDYKNIAPHIDRLDAAMKADKQQMECVQELTNEVDILNQSINQPNIKFRDHQLLSEKHAQIQQQLRDITTLSSAGQEMDSAYIGLEMKPCVDKLRLAPFPIDGEWLPRSAVYALVDLSVVIFGRPKGLFKESGKRIQSGIEAIQGELSRLGITDGVREVELQHSAIWMAGVYLMLLMQFLENKVAADLTRADFVEAQEAIVQMRNWYIRFPTILQACESIIEMLRGQYAHSVGCFSEAAFHFLEAAKLTESKPVQAICQVYAAVSYICIGDTESSSQALDLIDPVYREMDSFIGVREKTSVLFAYGLLLVKQQNLHVARIRLATGLQLTHSHLGNLQLVSQYLTVLGSLAISLHDNTQAREILRSALTLAKKLNDVPTQIWVLSALSALYQDLGERENEMENADYQRKKVEDLQKRLDDAHASIHHLELIDKSKIEVEQLNESDIKRGIGSSSMRLNLDIPESVGLAASMPMLSSSRLVDLDSVRRGKRKV